MRILIVFLAKRRAAMITEEGDNWVRLVKNNKRTLVKHKRNLVKIFFFNDTATTEIYTLSLHDALPISVDNGTVCLPVLTISIS